jgi:ABC-type proline/glycine betaine transport system permease subunit
MTKATAEKRRPGAFAPEFGPRGELRQRVGEGGRVHIDRWLPFIILHRSADPNHSIARRVATNSPAYLIWSPEDDGAAEQALIAVGRALHERFGCVLVIDVADAAWAPPEEGSQALPPFEPLQLLYNNTAVVIGIVYVYLPFMVLPLYATLERLDRSYLEASLDLGAGQIRTFFSIIVPLARPGIVSGVILVFVPALGTFLISDLLGGPDSQLLGNVIERQFKDANHWPLGAAMSFLLMYVTFAALALRAFLAERDV